MRLIVQLLISTLAVMVTQYVLPGVSIDTYFTGIVVAVLLGVMNTILKPILVVLTLPITVVTFGLFLVVINAFVIQLTSSIIDGFEVDSFWWAVFFSLILSIVTSIFNGMNDRDEI